MASSLAPRTPAPPRLVQAALRCKPLFDEALLDALIQAPNDASVPSNVVQAIDVPGHDRCGWVVGGDAYAPESTDYDDFFNGAGREGSTRCADLPDQVNVWAWNAGHLLPLMKEALREGGVSLRQVRDLQTGKLYLLTEGKEGARCSMHYGLPQAYEWQDGAGGPRLQLSGDDRLVVRLLLAQCEESDPSDPLACRGIASLDVPEETPEAAQPVADALQEGHGLPIDRVVDWLGNARRKAYAAAIAAHDHAALRRLLAQGLPARWTAEEIRAVGKSTLALEEKRRRIALLFADPGQLARALQSDPFGLPDILVPWLPDQDWAPVLHVIERSADLWRPAASELRASAVAASRPALACAIDHAQGYLCGGGIEPN